MNPLTALRFTWWAFTRVFPPLMALGLPLLAIYGLLDTGSDDLSALRLRPGEAAVLVGITAGPTCTSGQLCDSPSQRAYLIVPRVFSTNVVSSVVHANPPHVVEDRAALVFPAIWCLCIFGTWYYWIRKPKIAGDCT